MNRMTPGLVIDDRHILALRRPKNRVDPQVPYASLVEPERTATGLVEDVATIFLTNRECPFRCLFCDLWKNTTDERVSLGAIPAQISHALARLPQAKHIKLYNSGNFFDRQAIPPEDYPRIARLVAPFHTVIVENHPRLCGPLCLEFRDELEKAAGQFPKSADQGSLGEPSVSLSERMLDRPLTGPQLEVALGLETVHPEILPRLNKQMTVDDFSRAAEFLRSHQIALRAFILLKPPFMQEDDCVEWALRSMEFAFDCGVGVCSVIPTRSGNGIMEQLERGGEFSPPRLASLEKVLADGIALGRGRVFVDLWEVERVFECARCGPKRAARLSEMNLSQQFLPPIPCDCA